MARVGLLHPGQMGAFLGCAVAAAGHTVVWAAAGRSEATRTRAAAFHDVGTLAAVAEEVSADPDGLIVAICPPSAALDIAEAVAACGYTGRYLDANAVSPSTIATIATILPGARVIDGAVIGGPRTRDAVLHVAGPGASELDTVFSPAVVTLNVLDGAPGTASALKACYAASTKAVGAVVLAARAAAAVAGIERELLAEWERLPVTAHVTDIALAALAGKAWRFAGEMDEAALFFADVGVPDGFSRAAALTYKRIADLRDLKSRDPESIALDADEILAGVAGSDLPRTLDHL